MKPMIFAACAVGVIVALTVFVQFTPEKSVAGQPNTTIVGGPDHGDLPQNQKTERPVPNEPAAQSQGPQAAFSFGDVPFFHRSSQSNEQIDLHEFTPADQDDLFAWTDMVSIIHYRDVNDAEGLAAIASLLVSAYASAGGDILVTRAVPATNENDTEFLVVGVLFDRGIVEAVFNRLTLHDGTGTNMMVSKRAYGDTGDDEMETWLRDLGQITEDHLMSRNIGTFVAAVPTQ